MQRRDGRQRPRLGVEDGAEQHAGLKRVEHHLLPRVAEDAEPRTERDGDAGAGGVPTELLRRPSTAAVRLRLVEELVEEGGGPVEPAVEHQRGFHGHGLVVRARSLGLWRGEGAGGSVHGSRRAGDAEGKKIFVALGC